MLRVVIVEDELLVKKGLLLTTDWEGFGCEVVGEASNGYEGIDAISRLRPDIVLTDIRMPGIDGIQMIEALKTQVDVEYIIITGYSEFEYARSAVRLGVKDYLIKPINDEELADAVRKACNAVRDKRKINKIERKIDDITDSKVMMFKEYLLDAPENGKPGYVDRMIKYICDNYQRNINIKDVSESLRISESHISRLFKSEVGYTFVDYLTYYRVKKAIQYLRDPDIRIYEVAERIGYKDQRYFSVIFKKLVGVTPTEFRES
jgi:two-component system response regulator YesN